MKQFLFCHREARDSITVDMSFFSDENGFDDDDVRDVDGLKFGETIVIGMEDCIVTRIWDKG